MKAIHPGIVVITGASGVGKTTLSHKLTSILNSEEYEFFAFDSIAIPTVEEMIAEYGSPSEWQKAKTFDWLKRLVNSLGDRTIVFEGQMNIEFILQGFEDLKFNDYTIVLLDCEEAEMRRRLIHERGQPELANQDMANWLAYLRNQAIEKNVKIINTSRHSMEELVSQMLDVIKG